MKTTRIPLGGSERKPTFTGNAVIDTGVKPDPEQLLEVTVSVRRKNPIPVAVSHNGFLNHEKLSVDFGATEADFKAIADFAMAYDLRVTGKDPAALTIKLSGTLQNMERAFGTTLHNSKEDDVVYRTRTGFLTIPAELEGIIEGVFGLDNRPQASPRFRLAPLTDLSFSPIEVASLYNFPDGDGKGEIISIIELGGGFVADDLESYFSNLGLAVPNVVAIPVSGGSNMPTGDAGGPDGEVMLDIEIAGAIAPQATIKVYFAPNSDKGFFDAINAAIFDPEPPTVVSISWGAPEGAWTGQTLKAFEKAFESAAAIRVIITVASGDNGSTDGTGALAVDFPASAPHSLACGGTHLEGKTKITKEVVWNSNGGSTGGGISDVFEKPAYQSQVNLPSRAFAEGGRGVPDISGNAAPETGYKIRVDGVDAVIGGTSAVSPLLAGLIARLAQNSGQRIPFLNAVLYDNPGVLRDITQGNNDVGDGNSKFQAGRGWDACTGLGSPDGMAILAILKSPPISIATANGSSI